MKKAIIFTGGIVHPFETAAPALKQILQEVGIASRVSFDIAEIRDWMRADADALVIVYALRWSMTQHEKYAPYREQWAFTTTKEIRDLITNHVSAGAGLLGVHTASICFDDWDGWDRVLGGAWEWGKSHHPPLGPVKAHLDTHHFLAHGLDDFSLNDEVYAQQRLMPGIEIFGWAQSVDAASPAGPHPVCWTHHYGHGRVVYDALGHDAASLNQPTHRRLLQRAALWANGESPEALGSI